MRKAEKYRNMHAILSIYESIEGEKAEGVGQGAGRAQRDPAIAKASSTEDRDVAGEQGEWGMEQGAWSMGQGAGSREKRP